MRNEKQSSVDQHSYMTVIDTVNKCDIFAAHTTAHMVKEKLPMSRWVRGDWWFIGTPYGVNIMVIGVTGEFEST